MDRAIKRHRELRNTCPHCGLKGVWVYGTRSVWCAVCGTPRGTPASAEAGREEPEEPEADSSPAKLANTRGALDVQCLRYWRTAAFCCAHEHGELSEGQLARLLETDRLTARETFQRWKTRHEESVEGADRMMYVLYGVQGATHDD